MHTTLPKFKALLFEKVSWHISTCPEDDQVKIQSALVTLESGDFQSVHTKQLDGPIRELIVKDHRLLFFIIPPAIYFIRSFRKKSQKTPRYEIEYALKKYRLLNNR